MTAPAAIRQSEIKRVSYAQRVRFESDSDGEVGYVYFIRPANEPFFKIGWAKDFNKRLNELQVGNHCPLSVCFAARTFAKSEKLIHAAFKPLRTNGEWFQSHGAIFELMDELECAALVALIHAHQDLPQPIKYTDLEDIPLPPLLVLGILDELEDVDSGEKP
jgi:hypothetical protein